MTQDARRSLVRPRPVAAADPPVAGAWDRRLRAACCCEGWAWVALVVAVGAVLGMGADFAWPLSPGGAVGDLGGLARGDGRGDGRGVLRPLLRGRAALDLAAVAERTHPGLGERLTGAVALLDAATAAPRLAGPDRRAGRRGRRARRDGRPGPRGPAEAAGARDRAGAGRAGPGRRAGGPLAGHVRHPRPAVPRPLGRPRPDRPVRRDRRAGRPGWRRSAPT